MRSSFFASGALALFFLSSSARADDGAQARAAYESGSAAYAKGDYAAAATSLALADAIDPNPVALEAALRAVLHTGDAALGMDLASRAEQRSGRRIVDDLAQRARTQFTGLAGRVTARCPPDRACSASAGGEPLTIGTPRWMAAGERVIEFTVAGKTTLEALRVEAGASVDVAPRADLPPPLPVPTTAPPAAPPAEVATPVRSILAPTIAAPPPPSRGLSPAWFIGGAAVTAVLGVSATVSGVDTLSQHSAFVTNPGNRAKTAGEASQLRTNGFLVGTGVAAAATAAIGLFAVRWSSPARDVGKGPSTLTVIAAAGGVFVAGCF